MRHVLQEIKFGMCHGLIVRVQNHAEVAGEQPFHIILEF
jgi:hypothetical protein